MWIWSFRIGLQAYRRFVLTCLFPRVTPLKDDKPQFAKIFMCFNEEFVRGFGLEVPKCF